ncbi:MAG: YeiH family protein [Gemmataceae bacterium]|nr:YeiH family protein [Gemmataceae bacterium]MDW8265924.1 putative sulfate exporter family transporter [Gemmataceae bacterium]
MKHPTHSEDGWAVLVGLILFALTMTLLGGIDSLGWVVVVREWTALEHALAPVSPAYASLAPVVSLVGTFFLMVGLFSLAAWLMGREVRSFVPAFAVLVAVSYACLVAGHHAWIAATPDKRAAHGLSWSMGLTGEAGYIFALAAGLVVGNCLPRWAAWLKPAARPEWFVKTAIVILGAALGVKAAGATRLASAVLFRGFAAIVEAYLIYWALVYLLARTVFKFSREWAAPLASGISICGVSAAITTGAAIRARPVVPIMVSSLVVIFAVVELLVLPWLAQACLYHEPLVAGAWMGLAVKTDGAAVASGAITDALIRSRAQADLGLTYEEGWIVGTATTVKMFIDVFIGIWAVILSLIWVYRIDPRPGATLPLGEIGRRFPKFVVGYFLTFLVVLTLCLTEQGWLAPLTLAAREADVFRTLLFTLTFLAIGLEADFRRLWAEGVGRLAVAYVVSLFGFIIWIGLAISWIFFQGVQPPTVGG